MTAVTQERLARPVGGTGARRRSGVAVFLAPFAVLFGAFLVLPALALVVISLTEWEIVGTPEFVGLANYLALFGDPEFHNALRNTAYYVLLSVPGHVVLSLALAVLLNAKLRGARVVRAIVYTPVVIMVTVVGVLWSWLYDEQFGLVNHYFGVLGIGPVPWLTDSAWAMPAIVLASLWWTVGADTVIYLAGLQDIPAELYEAAELDGAGPWQRFRHVTLPSLANVHAFVVPFTLIASWQVFGQVYVLTGGGPGTSTVVLTQYVYLTAFQNYEMGAAAAASVVMLLIVLASALGVLRTRKVSL